MRRHGFRTRCPGARERAHTRGGCAGTGEANISTLGQTGPTPVRLTVVVGFQPPRIKMLPAAMCAIHSCRREGRRISRRYLGNTPW